MRKTGSVIIAILLAVAAGYYYYGYEPQILRRMMQQALDNLSNTLATKDRTQVSAALKSFLADNAKIRLEVRFVSLSQAQEGPVEIEDFDKPALLTLIDNTLYSLQDYGMHARLQAFSLSKDKQDANVIFSSQEWGHSESSYGAVHMNTRFAADTLCDGHILFTATHPVLESADCRITLRALPGAGEAQKMPPGIERLMHWLR